MFGFFAGFATAVVLIGFKVRRMVRRRRRSGGSGRQWAMSWVLSELDARPDQRTEILDAVEEFMAASAGLKSEVKTMRPELVEALRSEDAGAQVDAAVASRRPLMDQSLDVFQAAFKRIHEALDSRQRFKLAELVEAGPRGWRRGHARGCA